MTVRVITGDCRDVLRTLPAESVHCVVTSPPYFGQRDYDCDGQIGLEETPDTFVAEMVAVFREARRALRSDGTLWLNLGDSYNNRTRIRRTSHKPVYCHIPTRGRDRKTWAQSSADGEVRMTIRSDGLKEKDLFGIPWMVAFALRADGWYLRQEIVWSKPVGKLDVASDRPTTRHEQIFLFSKSSRYHFGGDALPEFARGSVWKIPATGHTAHGGAYPPMLVEPCILAGCPAGGCVLDPFGGAGTTGIVADRLGRDAILIELNPAYADMARARIGADAPLLAKVAAE